MQFVVCELEMEGMDSDGEPGYKPPPEFQVEAKEPLMDCCSTDSTELWLIQWPNNREVSSNLRYLFGRVCFDQNPFTSKEKEGQKKAIMRGV